MIETWISHPLAVPGAIVGGALLLTVLAPLIATIVLGARLAGDRRIARSREAASARALENVLSAQNELAGRMAAQIDAQGATQRVLQERLDAMSGGLRQGFADQAEKTARTLTALQERLAVIDEARKNFVDLSAELSTQVGGLTDVLANKQRRGAFGEIQMADLIRDHLPASAFDLQATLSNRARPDCLIRLPKPPGPIAVDSKFPLEAFRRYAEAEDDMAREAAKRALRDDVLRHAKDIASKYLISGETADWAVMFLPSEAVFSTLHAEFPATVKACLDQRVGVVSPNTFMALLTTVRAVIQDARIREEAEQIQKYVGLMLGDVARLSERVQKAADSQRHAAKHLDDAQKSVEQFARRAEKVRDVEMEDSPHALDSPIKAAE